MTGLKVANLFCQNLTIMSISCGGKRAYLYPGTKADTKQGLGCLKLRGALFLLNACLQCYGTYSTLSFHYSEKVYEKPIGSILKEENGP